MRNLQQLMDMRGRVSLITGGAGHIGRSMAEALAELGSDIVLVDLNLEDLESVAVDLRKSFDVKVEGYVCDLERESEIIEIPGWVASTFGRLDVLINNAAFVGTSDLEGWATDFEHQSSATWRRAMDINLTSAFILTQGCKSLLDSSGKGTVVNIASIYGVYGPDLSVYLGTSMNNPAAYAASKGGLIQLTRWLSTVMAPNVRVNAISPGGVSRGQPEEFINRYTARTPLARMATEEDFKGAVAFFSSDLSQYVTGENLMVDGGWGAW